MRPKWKCFVIAQIIMFHHLILTAKHGGRGVMAWGFGGSGPQDLGTEQQNLYSVREENVIPSNSFSLVKTGSCNRKMIRAAINNSKSTSEWLKMNHLVKVQLNWNAVVRPSKEHSRLKTTVGLLLDSTECNFQINVNQFWIRMEYVFAAKCQIILALMQLTYAEISLLF